MIRPLSLCLLVVSNALLCRAAGSDERHFDFGKIFVEDRVEHTFSVTNPLDQDLKVDKVNLSAPLIVTAMPSRIAPGQSAKFTVAMETEGRKYGEYSGFVSIYFNNPKLTRIDFLVSGNIVPAIQFDPFAAFFVSTPRGTPKDASLEILNHEKDPINIISVDHSSTRFETSMETLEEGRRFRLTLHLKGDAPAGRATDTIRIVTSSDRHPFLEVTAHTNVKDRVYAFPDSLEIGTINTIELKQHPGALAYLGQEIMVYQQNGSELRVAADTDVPFFRLSTEQGNLKDRAGIRVAIVPEKLKSGDIKGSITITSNDPDVPVLKIPVTGAVAGDW